VVAAYSEWKRWVRLQKVGKNFRQRYVLGMK